MSKRFWAAVQLCVKWLFVTCSAVDQSHVMQGFNLRFPAIINKPFLFVEKEPNGTASFKGFSMLVADYLTTALNITYSLVPVNTTLILQRGFNQVPIDMLLNNEVDMVMAPVVPNLARKSIMDFSYPLSFDAYKIAYPVPQETSRLLAPVWPYQKMVWILFVCSILVTTLVLGLMSWFWTTRRKSADSSGHFGRVSMYVIAIAFSQGDFLPYRSHSIRMAATGWCLMVVVLVNSYSGILTSYLTLPVYEKPINSLQDLAERSDIQLLVPTDSVLYQTFMEAQTGVYKAIGDGIRKRPGGLYKTIEQGLKLFFSGKYAYISAAFYIEYMLAEDYKLQKKCRFTVSKALDFNIPVSFGLPKNGPYNQLIDIQFIRMWEYGMINHWLDGYRGRFEQCIIKPKSPQMAALKLKDLYTAFIILLLGVGLSLLALLVEKLSRFFKAFSLCLK